MGTKPAKRHRKIPAPSYLQEGVKPSPPQRKKEREVLLDKTLLDDEIPTAQTAPAIFEDTDPQAERSELQRKVAHQAHAFTWQGKTLAPFAIDREGDWLVHRALIEAPELSVVFGRGSAFTLDACRILWFLSHDPEEWDGSKPEAMILQKLINPEQENPTPQQRAHILEKRIRAWAVTHIPPGTQFAAVDLAFEIYNRAHSTRAIVKPDAKEAEEKAGNSPARD